MKRSTVIVLAIMGALVIVGVGAVSVFFFTSIASDGSGASTAKGDGEMSGEVIPPDKANSDDPTIKFLQGEGKVLVDFTKRAAGLHEEVGDGKDKARCQKVADSWDKEFPSSKLLSVAARTPDSQLGSIVADQITAVVAVFETCRNGESTVGQIADGVAELSKDFKTRVAEL